MTIKLSVEGLVGEIASIADEVRETLQEEHSQRYSREMVRDALTAQVARKLDLLQRDLLETFTSPGSEVYAALLEDLSQRVAREQRQQLETSIARAKEYGDESVFTGNRAFSKNKMAAMIKYLTAAGHHVYKTSLNKLLFYSDLTSFYLSGSGISGAAYINRPYGPVADQAASLLNELVTDQAVKVDPRMHTLVGTDERPDGLTPEEIQVLDWVAETYGRMSAGEVSEFSHGEMAYRNTRSNEPIAYAYAQFLKRLPPKDLLSS